MSPIYLNLVGNKLLISFDYNPHIHSELKKIPGARWNKGLARWEAPLHTYGRLLEVLDNVKISKAVIDKLSEEAEIKRKVDELRKLKYYELQDYSPKVSLMSHQKIAFELHRMIPGSGNFGQMGVGKCRNAKDLQLINGELVSAEDTWNRYAVGATIFDGEGWWASTKEPLYVNSIDQNGKIVTRLVKRLYKQNISEKLRKIKLDDGSETNITFAHKLYLSDKWSNELEVGNRVCVPRFLPQQTGEMDLELAELFGWMIGDGCDSNPKSNRHRFTQERDLERDRVSYLVKSVTARNNIPITISEYRREGRPIQIEFGNKLFRSFCEQHGYIWGKLAAGKSVPSSVMKGNEAVVITFLRAIFDAEGSVLSNKFIEISSASEYMLKQINTLLRRFGIWLRTRKKRARATNGLNIWRDYYVGIIGGPSARIFYEKIGFSVDYKQKALEEITKIKANSNTEGMPAYNILREIVDTTKLPVRHLTGDNGVYLKGTQETSRVSLSDIVQKIDKILDGSKYQEISNLPEPAVHAAMLVNYEHTKSYKTTAKRLNDAGLLTKEKYKWHGPTVKTIIKKGECFPYKDVYDNLDKNWLHEKRSKLQRLIDQEVHYAKIVDIQEYQYDGWVYDLEVEDDHNYVAENILCHNTASAICSIHWHIETGKTENALIICPKSVMPGWEEQIAFFSNLSCVSIAGTKKEDRMAKLALKRNIYLVNYEYTWRILDELLEKKFNMVVCDEAHRIKNPTSNQSKACYTLGDAAQYRIGMTGTPVLNSPMDAFGVMRFIDSSVFGESFYAFRSKYFKNVGPENSPIPIFVPKGGADQEISDKMYTKAIRFITSECLELPPAVHLPDRIVTLSPEQDKAYRKLQEELCAEITETKSIKLNHVLTLMLKLNQITSGWVKDPDTGEIIHFKDNPKFEELKDVVEEAGEQSIIIWAYYIADMTLLTNYYGRCTKCKAPVNNIKEADCPKCGTFIRYRCSEIQGSTKHRNAEMAKFRFTPEERAKQREKLIEEGKTPSEVRAELADVLEDGSEPPQTNIFCAQITAASEGLNLQVSTASIFLSRNWSLKDYQQALARNHRQGQTKSVTYVNLVARMMDGSDTIDQRIVDALKRKEDLSKKINKDDLKLLIGESNKKDREALKDVTIDESDVVKTEGVVELIDDSTVTAKDVELF